MIASSAVMDFMEAGSTYQDLKKVRNQYVNKPVKYQKTSGMRVQSLGAPSESWNFNAATLTNTKD